jgi:hypothetical protein
VERVGSGGTGGLLLRLRYGLCVAPFGRCVPRLACPECRQVFTPSTSRHPNEELTRGTGVNFGATSEQHRPNTAQNRTPSGTRRRSRASRLRTLYGLQNLHPRFKSGRRLQSKSFQINKLQAQVRGKRRASGAFWTTVLRGGPENLHRERRDLAEDPPLRAQALRSTHRRRRQRPRSCWDSGRDTPERLSLLPGRPRRPTICVQRAAIVSLIQS